MPADRLGLAHVVQSVLAAHGPFVVPVLLKSKSGLTLTRVDGREWELATWRPGRADFHDRPTPARLVAAMRMLGQIHRTLGDRIATPWPFRMEAGLGRDVVAAERRRSKSAARRAERLAELVSPTGRALQRASAAKAPPELQPLVRDAVALVEHHAPADLSQALHWQDQDLPLQYRLGDIHDDHILFVDDEVTGVIDFGAVDFDSPAGDVARLLGSLVGDDRDRWREGFAAYESVRPLTAAERRAAEFFHTSGSVVAAANWLAWLWPNDATQAPPIPDRDRAVARLSRLVERLRNRA
jgi:Ser/Thr protein kinase RdoA (MazF antagonist)